MLWAIISWIVIGVVVGAIARALVPGRQSMGFFGTAGLGIAGALIGGLISWLFTGMPDEGYRVALAWPGWILSIIGSIILLVLLYKRQFPR